jgi:hypothetical protein
MTLKTLVGITAAGMLALLVAGCTGPSAEELFSKAQSKHADAQHVLDSLKRKADPVELFTPVVAAYELIAEKFPKSEQTEQALFKAAELRTQYLNDVPGSVALYKRYAEAFPAAAKAPTALFMVGYLYNNTLLKPDSAAIAYKHFLELYPQNELATSAQFELQTIGKKPEDLIPQPVPSSVTSAPPKKAAAAH